MMRSRGSYVLIGRVLSWCRMTMKTQHFVKVRFTMTVKIQYLGPLGGWMSVKTQYLGARKMHITRLAGDRLDRITCRIFLPQGNGAAAMFVLLSMYAMGG